MRDMARGLASAGSDSPSAEASRQPPSVMQFPSGDVDAKLALPGLQVLPKLSVKSTSSSRNKNASENLPLHAAD